MVDQNLWTLQDSCLTSVEAYDLCLVTVCRFMLVNTLGQTRHCASSHEISCQGLKNKGVPWESVELGQSQ